MSGSQSASAASKSRSRRRGRPQPAARRRLRSVDAHAVRGRGLQRVANVEVMGEGLGPVLGRVHGGVGAHVVASPSPAGGPGRSGAPAPPVVGALVAESSRARSQRCVVARQDREVVVADLVAQVAEHGPVGLAHLLAHRLPVRVVGLGEVERDHAVGVAGGDRLAARWRAGRRRARVASRAIGSPSSPSSNSSRRLAASATRLASPEPSSSAGPVRVSAHEKQSSPGVLDEPVAGGELGVRAAAAGVSNRVSSSRAGQSKPSAVSQLRQLVLEEDQLAAVSAGEGAHRAGRVAAIPPPTRRVPSQPPWRWL